MKRFRLPIRLTVSGILLITHTMAQEASNPAGKVPDFKELPEISWTFSIAKAIYSSPVVFDNVVCFGGLDSTLYSININSGKEIWHFKTKGEIRSGVCIHENFLFLNGGDGHLYALEKSSGKMVWMFKTKGEKKYDFADYFHSTPVYIEGKVIFGSGDGSLYAVNANTGLLEWQFQTSGIVHTKPAISKGKVFIGSFDGFVYALSLANGELIWKFKTVGHRHFPSGEVQGSPFVFDDAIIIGARDYNVYCLDQHKGFCHWNKAFSEGWGLCNNIHDSVLYIGTADERALIAADPFTGHEFWKRNMEFLVFGDNAYSDSLLYVGTTIGKLHGISLTTGEKVWSFETDSYRKNRYKYFKEDDSYRDDIYSVIKSNEHFLEVECELGGIFSTPCITEDYILFSSTNGTLYCLHRR
ncbi:MAG: PQQ-binding-like beta-propeller repeat protein [Bacteroidota bacterium]